MKSAQYVISCLCLCAAAHLSFADTHVWVGGNSSGGGWNTPSNWTNEQGVAECPSANDTVVFNQWNQTNVVTDADFDLFNSMAHVQLAAWSWRDKCGQTLVLSSTEDRTINCRVSGSGRMIITGSRRIELAPRDSGGTKHGGYFASYCLSSGGIVLEDDCTLVLAQTGFAGSNGFTYGPMTIGEDATVIAASNLNYNIIERLYGSGTIRCDNGTATDKWLQIGWSGNYSTEMAVFSGKITGYGKLINYSNQALTGTESDIVNPSNPYFYSCTGYGRNYMDRGWTYVASIGMKNQPSSIGVGTWILLGYGGHLGYIGEGETSDRSFCFEGRESTGLHPQYIDGGPHGGLELSGNLYVSAYGSEYNQRSVVFSGSNAAPCTVSGDYDMNYVQNGTNYHFYTRKEGPGTWEFKKNSGSSYGGVFDIREGTLRFDSLAEAGTNCALGKATRLTREFTGKYKSEYDSIYAIRLGTTNLVGAADAVLEFNGAGVAKSTTRPLLLTGMGHLRANGIGGAPLLFGGVTATAGEKTLVIDGTNTSANTLMDVADGDGVVSVVKDGPGTWWLAGNHTFSGDLVVKQGALKLAGNTVFRYFRVTFWDNVFNHPNGSYINEFAIYSADGTRLNRNFTYVHPDGYTDSSRTYYLSANRAAELDACQICWDYIPGITAQGVWDYTSNGNTLDKLCDGTTSGAQFVNSFRSTKYAVSMRLADDAKEAAYVDFVQSSGNYDPNKEHPYARQTGSAFTVEGSADGSVWTTLVTTNTLADLVITNAEFGTGYYECRATKWFFSDSQQKVVDYPGDRTLGEGEGLALTARAAIESDLGEILTNVRSISVATGAVFEVDGVLDAPLVLSQLKIDGTAGAGAIRGFDFAPNMTVDVTGIPSGTKTLNLPVDFTGVTNFDNVASWTFLKDGAPTTRYRFELSKTGLKIDAAGLMVIVR